LFVVDSTSRIGCGAGFVANCVVTFARSGLPPRSSMPPVPPASVAVYEAPRASASAGVSVAVRVAASYATDAGTTAFDASRSLNVVPVSVEGSIASLNVARTVAPLATPVAPSSGVSASTLGG
jgi:hypothetical protein